MSFLTSSANDGFQHHPKGMPIAKNAYCMRPVAGRDKIELKVRKHDGPIGELNFDQAQPKLAKGTNQ
jgi:hypothetical protein